MVAIPKARCQKWYIIYLYGNCFLCLFILISPCGFFLTCLFLSPFLILSIVHNVCYTFELSVRRKSLTGLHRNDFLQNQIELKKKLNWLGLKSENDLTHGGNRIRKKSFGVKVGNLNWASSLSEPDTGLHPGMRVAPRTPSHSPTPAALMFLNSLYDHIMTWWLILCVVRVVGRIGIELSRRDETSVRMATAAEWQSRAESEKDKWEWFYCYTIAAAARRASPQEEKASR